MNFFENMNDFWWNIGILARFIACISKDEVDQALTHFKPMFHFYTPWKCQKTKGFLMYSEGIERNIGLITAISKTVYAISKTI